MLTKSEYDILMDIAELPRHGFPEGDCPSYISWPKIAGIVSLGYMEKATLALPGDDPGFPDGRSWYRISPLGYHHIEEYEEKSGERKFQMLSTALGHVISIVAK